MRKLGFAAWTLLAILLVSTDGTAKDKPKDEPKTVELTQLEKNEGANFGDWVVWRYDDGGRAIFLINQKTGYAIYVPWSSNGWVNYRDKAGTWFVVFSKGQAEKQNRDDLKIKMFLDMKRPAVDLEPGKSTFKDWTVTVSKDEIKFRCGEHDDRMTIRRGAGAFVHNGRTIGGK